MVTQVYVLGPKMERQILGQVYRILLVNVNTFITWLNPNSTNNPCNHITSLLAFVTTTNAALVIDIVTIFYNRETQLIVVLTIVNTYLVVFILWSTSLVKLEFT